MDYTRLMEKAISFIEGRLTTRIELEDIADVANFSMFHFHRMFVVVVGTTPKDYIRRRRLSRAARELVFSTRPISEIATRYQFISQASFTRAFKKQFETTPGKLRRTKSAFTCFNAIDVKNEVQRKGAPKMEVKIVEKEAFKVIGLKVVTTQKKNTIPQLWDKFNARWQDVKNIAQEGVCVGICPSVDDKDFDENTEFAYIAGMIVKNFTEVPEGMETLEIPAQKYAVATHKGPLDKLHDTYHYLYAEWLKDSDYEFCPSAEIEWYDDRFIFNSPESEFDIYIPVK
ncbi:MAG: AraC family transcriptional regulator [Candidatus Cloacimonetes bacterium]|nr:AraC family transcriptional regulator [Candidatus Cloacimonadota bacterium]